MKFKTIGLSIIIALAIAVVGCGGGGGGAASSGAKVGFYVTDDLRLNTDAVWGTVYKVDLIASDSSVVNVFDDSAGKEFNFRALNDGANNLFSFLSTKNVPTGKTFNQVAVTMGNQIRVLETGDNSTSLYNVIGAAAGAGRVKVTYNLPAPRTFGAGDDLAIDFDLANFVVSGSDVTPSIKDGDRTGINDDNRHESDEIKGTVSNLTGTSPNFEFQLSGAFGTVTVVTTSGTVFYNSDSSANPTLANNKRVEVEGILDGTTGDFNAYKVKIKVGNETEDPDQAKGQDSNRNSAAGTFDLEASETEGFIPTDRNIHITTTDTTTYRDNNGSLMNRDTFFAALDASAYLTVEAEGTYNSGNNTLAAKRLKLEDEKDDHQDPTDSDVRGLAINLNADAGTFTATNIQVEGFPSPGTTINIVTTGTTEFKNASLQKVTKSEWFAALALLASNLRTIKAEGTWNGTVFTARELTIED